MELREYVRACRRRWLWIVVPVLLAAGAAAGLSLTAQPAYRSSMVLFVTTGTGDPDAKASRLNSYIVLLTGPRVAESVITKLKLPMTTAQVQASLSAQVQEGTDLLVVSATDASAERSKEIVTTATTALVGLAKQLDPPSTAPTDGPTPSVSIAQNPVTTEVPGNLVRNIGFSAVLGLLIGAVAVAVREATRKTIGEEDDLRRLGLGAVGLISLGGRSGRNGYPDEALAEAFRRLRSLLPDVAGMHSDAGRGTSLLLTGAQPKEGTTAVACGLAIAMAETGATVVLVDANMRSPGVGRYLALDTSLGLSDVLSGSADVPDVLQDSLDGRLTVLPSGEQPPDPGEILASPRLGATVRALTERFDVVIVDAPPLHGVADAAVLSKVTDSALLVVRANRTRTVDVERSMDLLERVGARLAGAVLNALPKKLPTSGNWHRGAEVPAASDPELVTQLFGATGQDDQFAGPADGADETVTTRPAGGTARGRAVVKATVGTPEEAAAHPRDAAGAAAARGQARVVVAQPVAVPPVVVTQPVAVQPVVVTQPVAVQPVVVAQPAPDPAEGAEPPHLPAQRTPDEKSQPGE
ncbi:polysaccharide biosynthesis tyrosine autokinase [Actinoplanes sp. CA-051413]|uniref:polysaccharide biosynthesis tyrosine autokinase n=1 Tax=Actinoplanes sp. CA-051413 TaxID=3239899 RepID=UPI003D97AA61